LWRSAARHLAVAEAFVPRTIDTPAVVPGNVAGKVTTRSQKRRVVALQLIERGLPTTQGPAPVEATSCALGALLASPTIFQLGERL